MIPVTQFTCPNPVCGKRLKTDSGTTGKSARCHGCGTRFRLTRSISADGTEIVVPTDPEIPPLGPLPPPAVAQVAHPLPVTIGRFQVLSPLGGGAFGLVYRARDPELERDVAVKLPKPGTLNTPARVKRFLGDAKAAARLRHPHIVPVFDVGDHEGGWFIASAFIDGRTLADALDERRLDLRAKATVVRRLAEALDYAHGQGVVHRDVKPDNVMLDAADQPHLIDFGLAKLGDDREGGGRAVMGTAVYMSPEQASGNSHDADARSDQYSLGVTLYELLGGRTPFSGPTSLVLFNVVNTPPPPLAGLDPSLPLELILICQRAMAKNPADRYANCGEFADDLRRWLDGETPRVRVLTRRERLVRWIRKEPKLATAIGVAAASVILVAVLGVTFGLASNRQAVRLAEANAELVESRGEEAQARQRADNQAMRAAASEHLARKSLASANYDRAIAECEKGEIAQGMNWFLEAIREADAAGDAALARAARVNLNAWRYQLNALEHILPLTYTPLAVAAAVDGSLAVVVGEFEKVGYITQFDPQTGVTNHTVRVESPIRAVVVEPHGKWFVTGDDRGHVQVWAKDCTKLGDPVKLPKKPILAVALHPSQSKILAGCADGIARLIHSTRDLSLGLVTTEAHKEYKLTKGFAVNAVAFHPDAGTPLVLIGGGPLVPTTTTAKGNLGEVRQFHADTGAEYGAPVERSGAVRAVAYRPNGQEFLTGTGSLWMGEGRVWGTEKQVELQGGVFPHLAEVNAVAYARNGRFLVTAGQDRAVRVWDAKTYRPIGQPLWHGKDVRAVAVAGERVISVGEEQAVRVWAVAPGPDSPTTNGVMTNGLTAATAVLPGGEEVWVSRLRRLPLGSLPVVERWSIGTGAFVADLPVPPEWGPVRAMATGGGVVAVGGGEDGKPGFVAKVDKAGSVLQPFPRDTATVYAIGMPPDCSAIVVGCDDGALHCRPVKAGGRSWSKTGAHESRVYATTFSPDGKTLLTCAKDNTAALWNAENGRLLCRLELRDIGLSATFAPGGRFLIGYAGGCRVYKWDGADLAEQEGVDLPHQAGVLFVSVEANGTTAITGGTDGRVRRWDLATRKPLGPWWPSAGLVRAARFTESNGVFVADTTHASGQFRTYSLPTGATEPLPQLTNWVRRTSGMQVANGVAEVMSVPSLQSIPGGGTATELAVEAWVKKKPLIPDPVPIRIALAPVPNPTPPVSVNPPDPKPMPPVNVKPSDPKPMPPVNVKPTDPKPVPPNPGPESGGFDLTAIAGAVLQLFYPK